MLSELDVVASSLAGGFWEAGKMTEPFALWSKNCTQMQLRSFGVAALGTTRNSYFTVTMRLLYRLRGQGLVATNFQ